MRTSTAIIVWAYLVAASLAEVIVFSINPAAVTTIVVIALLAVANAAVTGIFSMGLKDEPRSIHYLFLSPVVLVTVLILTLVFAFAH